MFMDNQKSNLPVLVLVIPCYNEASVLPVTAPMFLKEVDYCISSQLIDERSCILFVDDGSCDDTWNIICRLAGQSVKYKGISLSRNRGHQNALLAGLSEAVNFGDVTVTIDCDGQDDIGAITEMLREYHSGSEVVYGVRSDRSTDTWFKKQSAQFFYRLMKSLGAEVVYNHADYRLLSSKVLRCFQDYKEVNLFLRGIFPLIGFKSSVVYYQRKERLGGQSHYPLKKMLSFAFDGITSLSIKPIELIVVFGAIVSFAGFTGIIWAIVRALMSYSVPGWASIICMICFFSGIQLLSLGVIGIYIGKTYLEAKHRPRFVISSRTWKTAIK